MFEHEGVHMPYENNEGEEIDLSEKRLAFWMETVPKEIRRYEYELWKRYRTIFMANQHRSKAVRAWGRTDFVLPYSRETEKKNWKTFRDSFLFGEERKERFDKIVNVAEEYSRQFISRVSEQTGENFEDEVLLTAIGGSSFYGPRKEGEELSDIDLYFLINDQGTESSFERLPQVTDDPAFHIMGTGYKDESRLGREEIHWLLYPHYPLANKLSDDKLKKVIKAIVESTFQRQAEIQAEINNLDQIIDKIRVGL